jgi:hypothetical protein
MQTSQDLKPPPSVAYNLELCGIHERIYLYNKNVDADNLAVCAYQSELDKWFSVPEMKTRVLNAGMTSYNENLFLIGGGNFDASGNFGALGSQTQMHDLRTPHWQQLPSTTFLYQNPTCCVLDAKIYVCGGASDEATLFRGAEAFDLTAGKWRTIPFSNKRGSPYARVVPYANKIWLVNDEDLNVDVYNPESDTWTSSTLIVDALRAKYRTTPPYTLVREAVVFKSL